MEELKWFAVSQSDHFDEEFYTDLLQNVKNEESAYKEELKKLKEDDDVGPCQHHCDKLHIDINVDTLCSSLLPIVIQSVGDEHELHENVATL